jgi:hypothetical protein
MTYVYNKNYLSTYNYSNKDYQDYINEILKDTEIEYNLNSYGFRTKDFKKINPKDHTILYSGCSVTFGGFLPENHVWTYILTEKIKENNFFNNIVDYNLAFNAASIHAIVKNIFSFIELYGKPNSIFLCLPASTRDIYYDLNKKKFINAIKINHKDDDLKITKDTPKVVVDYSKNTIKENTLLQAITLMSMLEHYCHETNINLIWSTWNKNDEKIYNNSGFKNFIKINKMLNNKNNQNYKYMDIAKDGYHFGAAWHINTAEHYLQALQNML